MLFSRSAIVIVLSRILSYDAFQKVEVRQHEQQKQPSVYSWWCSDNLVCYQGPQDAMADMRTRALAGPMGVMYTSDLVPGACASHNFSIPIGQTCFGDTYASQIDTHAHMELEQASVVEYVMKHGVFSVVQPGCASCMGHC